MTFMPEKTLKPHKYPVIDKPRPGDTASMAGFCRPRVQKPVEEKLPVSAKQRSDKATPVPTNNVSKKQTVKMTETPKPERKPPYIDETTYPRMIVLENEPPVPVCEPLAQMGEACAKAAKTKKLAIGDKVFVMKDGKIIDSGEITIICVDMYFVETKNHAPNFYFGDCLKRIGG